MSSNKLNTCVNSVFIVNENNSLKTLQDNQKLNPFILRTGEREAVFIIREKNISLVEIELNIEALEFIEKVKSENLYEIKVVPAYFVRTICVRNINELTPLVDVYFAMKNLTQDVKRIILVNDAKVPGLNEKICLVEYNSHQSAKRSLAVLNALNGASNSYGRILSASEKPLEALWCEPLKDNIKEILNNTPFCYFENMLINNYSLFHFKQFLEDKLKDSDCRINKVRQFANKILVEFNTNVPLYLFDCALYYEGKFIPVVAAMRPSVNVGKYRERSLKASSYFLLEEDRKMLLSRFGDNLSFVNESLKKKAEVAYNKLIIEEKKLKEKEREKIERESSVSQLKRGRDKNEEVVRDKRDRSRDRDRKREKRERDRSEDKKAPTRDSVSTTTNTQGNTNYLSQLTNLLLNNPSSSNVLSNLSVLGNLQNLQNVLTNPAVLSLLQLINPNAASSNISNISNPIPPTANININPPQIQQQTKSIAQPVGNIIPNIPTQQTASSSAQINPIYNIPKPNLMDQQQQQMFYPQPAFNQKGNFYQNPNPQQNFPYGMPNDMYMGQIPYGSMPMQDFHPMDNVEMDNNMMMKKYYEYFQNLQQK